MKLKFICIASLMAILVSACGKDDNMEEIYDNGNSLPDNYDTYTSLYDKLFDTTWALQKAVRSDGFTYSSEYIGETLTFSSEYNFIGYHDDYHGTFLKLYSSLFSGSGAWIIDNNGDLYFTPMYSGLESEDSNAFGAFIACMGIGGKILTLNSSTLVFRQYYTYNYDEYTYKRVDYNGNQNGNNTGGGTNNSQYEKPEIGLEDYTCSTTSITVKYRIYNQSEAQVTSATGYYGTSSPSKSVTGSVSGSLITLRFNGLSKGTEYYIKCTAKGKGGSTTSETVRLSTYY